MASKKLGRPRVFVDAKPVSVRFERDLYRRLAVVAAAREQSVNALINEALSEWLDERAEASVAKRLVAATPTARTPKAPPTRPRRPAR